MSNEYSWMIAGNYVTETVFNAWMDMEKEITQLKAQLAEAYIIIDQADHKLEMVDRVIKWRETVKARES